MPDHDIMKVMDDHAPVLMAIPGVVGVAVGRLESGRPCIRIYVIELRGELQGRLPRELDGYPVDVEAGGEFRPLGGA